MVSAFDAGAVISDWRSGPPGMLVSGSIHDDGWPSARSLPHARVPVGLSLVRKDVVVVLVGQRTTVGMMIIENRTSLGWSRLPNSAAGECM